MSTFNPKYSTCVFDLKLFFNQYQTLFSQKYLRNGEYLASVHPIRDARGYLGEHEGSVRDARGAAYLSALPTIQVHPELDGR